MGSDRTSIGTSARVMLQDVDGASQAWTGSEPLPAGDRETAGLGAHALSTAQQIALLCRMLHREGYADHHFGHVSCRVAGALLVNPYELPWSLVRASDLLTLSLDGEVQHGSGTNRPAIELHLALHRARPDVVVAVHHHPKYATVWSAVGRTPPAYDQTSCMIRDERIAFVAEYAGNVRNRAAAEHCVAGLGECDAAFLSNHGVLVVGSTVAEVYARAVGIEHRSALAWRVEAVGGGSPMKPERARELQDLVASLGEVPFLFSSMAAREIYSDPTVLD